MASALRFMVLITLLGCVHLISVKIPQKFTKVMVGGSALLPCSFTTTAPTTRLTIQWEFEAGDNPPKQVYYYQTGLDYIGASYKGRIHAPSAPNVTKTAPITISNVQLSDAGVYTCQVHNLPDVEGNSEASIILKVLEPPSAPYCSVTGDKEAGHTVTLNCHSEDGSPTPTYSWTRLDQTRARVAPGGTVTKGGQLQIHNISQFEFGQYQCNASNAVGFRICTVELQPEASDGVIVGAVIGALLGCLLILLIVWFIAHMLKKQAYKPVKAPDTREMKAMPQDASRESTHQGNPSHDPSHEVESNEVRA